MMRAQSLVAGVVTAAIATAMASLARAADGVIEIDQVCATQTGCGSSDSPGFPRQTLTGRSYVLSSSLTVADADATAVSLASGATLAFVLDVAAHDNAGLGMRANYQNHRNAVGRSVFGYNDGGPAGDQAEIDVAIGANVCGAGVCP